MTEPPVRIAETRILRSPAAGPEPCNTLVFLRCLVPGLDVGIGNDEIVRSILHFQTEFRIDGYLQSQYEWYAENTLVSATASLKLLNTSTDLTFLMAVDSVEPELRQLDGSLAFHCGLAAGMEDDTWFGGGDEIVLTATLSAYVLCFEPREDRPPSGTQRTPWRRFIEQGPKHSDLVRRSPRDRASASLAETGSERRKTGPDC